MNKQKCLRTFNICFSLQQSKAIIMILVRGNGQNEALPDREIVKSQITEFEALMQTVGGKWRLASGILTMSIRPQVTKG